MKKNKYRIVPLSRWTFKNNSSIIKYQVEKKIFNLFWIPVSGKWISLNEAKEFINKISQIIVIGEPDE